MIRLLKPCLIIVTATIVSGPLHGQGDARITAEMDKKIIDKPAIAQEHVDRMIGLRESGNAHIPTGSRLRDATFAESRGDDYRDELRERALAMYGTREPNWSHPGQVDASQATTEENSAIKPESKRESSLLSAIAVGLACFLVLVLIVQNRRK